MEVKPGYKQTEIGVIPEDWDFIQLKNCIDLKNGYAFESAYFSDRGEVLLTPGNFSRTGGLQFDSTNTKRYNGKFPKDSVLSYGDLLLVMTDLTPDCKLLGKPAIVETKEPLLHNQRIAKVVNNQRKAINGFLFYVFLSDHYLRYLKDRATGSTVRHTSLRIISSFRNALPPIKEQIAISKTLSDIDSLITSLEKLIEKKKLIKQGVMQELLTGKRRLPGFSGKWETKRLGDIADVYSGGTPSTSMQQYWSGGIPWFTPTEIGSMKYVSASDRAISELGLTNSSAKLLPEGAIILTTRASIGDVSIMKCRGCTNQGCQSLVTTTG
jgi:type I restriction enzyme S subunit